MHKIIIICTWNIGLIACIVSRTRNDDADHRGVHDGVEHEEQKPAPAQRTAVANTQLDLKSTASLQACQPRHGESDRQLLSNSCGSSGSDRTHENMRDGVKMASATLGPHWSVQVTI